MNQAEKQVIETFCRELALALRRITGKTIEIRPDELPSVADAQGSAVEPSTPSDPNQEPKP